jgi:adenosylhomocysteine nucleosidase
LVKPIVRRWWVIVLVWVLAACAPAPRPTLIIAAFPVELAPLLPHITDQRTVTLPVGEVLLGTLDGQPIALVTTGAGLVNSAAGAQRAIDTLDPVRVIMVGVAGGLDPALDIGAVVIAAEWVNHQMGKVDAAGFSAIREAGPYPVDADLLALAQGLGGIEVGGRGASGDLFVDSAAVRDELFERTGARTVDMETAAVAQVAAQNGLPFIAIRAISDRAGGGLPGEVAYGVEPAAEAASDALRGLLRALVSLDKG